MKRVLNMGSLNIDHVYAVPHISRPGETLASTSYTVHAGGKGANQSAALARAGAQVFHAGRLGPQSEWLEEKLAGLGCDMRYTVRGETPTGHAIIQVDSHGQNSIVLYPGANHQLERGDIDEAISEFNESDILLLQNEINDIPYIIEQAKKRQIPICLNPAPFTASVLEYPLEAIDLLVFNQTEGQGLSAQKEPQAMLETLASRYPDTRLLLTLGADGLYYRAGDEAFFVAASPVKAVDTTAAGDTFIGFFLAELLRGCPPDQAATHASQAAALSVTRPGAMDSIPHREEISPSA